ncbi:hypothetical protein FVR03_23035 [Pontibacter qinzhouensis]|uniref:Lipoprotein n=1 Tax=Pontibacter qinzhouensis TaxID=2603253 RepID=A0A5C8IMZ9_9BACT|nr:hypothetical protein [Pontibacter qinzhouensis]TXK22434.1 hypothetical protein FVR03_23035 [Pontibacter qinzhouensis]
MAIEKKLLVGLCLTSLLLLTACPNPCVNELPLYNFYVEAYFTPEKDSLRVGDTLYFISEFPKRLNPHGSQSSVDYSNANISGSLSVVKLTPRTQFGTDAVFDFEYVSLAGQMYNTRDIPNPDGFQQFFYQESEDKYHIKIAIIPKEKGTYGLGILSTASNGRSGGNGCDKASFNTTVSNTDINVHYLEEFTGLPVTIRPSNGYYFRVY